MFVTFFEDEMHYQMYLYQENNNPNHVKILMENIIDDQVLVLLNELI